MTLIIYILLFSSMFAVSTSPIIARYLHHLDPILISFWRMAIASIIINIYCLLKDSMQPISLKEQKKTMTAGILLGIHFALFYSAISIMPNNIANATVFGTLAPLFALFIEIYFGRKISSQLIIGLFIVLSGSVFIFLNDFSFDSNLINGNILAILCSICFAFVFIISDQVRKENSAITFSRYLFSYAAITLLIVSIVFNIELFSISSSDIKFLLFLGIVPTIIGHSVFYYLVKYFRPTIVASIPLGEPFIASFIAWLLFPGQILNEFLIFGGVTTLIGLFIIIQSKEK